MPELVSAYEKAFKGTGRSLPCLGTPPAQLSRAHGEVASAGAGGGLRWRVPCGVVLRAFDSPRAVVVDCGLWIVVCCRDGVPQVPRHGDCGLHGGAEGVGAVHRQGHRGVQARARQD
jgi:hypothetical protein